MTDRARLNQRLPQVDIVSANVLTMYNRSQALEVQLAEILLLILGIPDKSLALASMNLVSSAVLLVHDRLFFPGDLESTALTCYQCDAEEMIVVQRIYLILNEFLR